MAQPSWDVFSHGEANSNTSEKCQIVSFTRVILIIKKYAGAFFFQIIRSPFPKIQYYQTGFRINSKYYLFDCNVN